MPSGRCFVKNQPLLPGLYPARLCIVVTAPGSGPALQFDIDQYGAFAVTWPGAALSTLDDQAMAFGRAPRQVPAGTVSEPWPAQAHPHWRARSARPTLAALEAPPSRGPGRSRGLTCAREPEGDGLIARMSTASDTLLRRVPRREDPERAT